MNSITGAYWIKKLYRIVLIAVFLLNIFLCALLAMLFTIPPVIALALTPIITVAATLTSVKIFCYSAVLLEKVRQFIVFLAKKYFTKPEFDGLKEQYRQEIDECNELCDYVTHLKRKCYSNPVLLGSRDKSESIANLQDSLLDDLTLENRHHCTETVYRAANQRRIQHLCSCFKIGINEKNLKNLEELYNDLSVLIEARYVWNKKALDILNEAKKNAPYIIREFGIVEFAQKIGLNIISAVKFHKFVFVHYMTEKKYWNFEVEMTPETLEELIDYIAHELERSGKVSQPGPIMSLDLMNSVKERDNNTCQRCGACANNDNYLVLELEWADTSTRAESIDQIQTVCWRCKRANLKEHKV